MTEPRTYPQGVPSWVDVETDDIESTTDFYGELFGWTFTEATPPQAEFHYLIAQLDGQDVAGVGGPVPTGGPSPGWNTYIAVDDADETAGRLKKAGGRILREPADGGPGGRSVVAADPAGAGFRLWQARRRLGAQLVNAPGTWNFSDLRAPDPSAATRFYTEVFGWQTQDSGAAILLRQPGYGEHLRTTIDPDIYERQAAIGDDGSFADAIAFASPAAESEAPHWHVSFAVADRDATAATAQRSGGTVLSQEEADWARTAELRGPGGEEFTISQFLA
ncbi:VOC family protein [Brachybacterium sacelli]|uniref:Enzyme related to lactoylglutathione lyase n=1 Tax=Brachybacterium sacelli TaxID=173364 RepID=A0ABS4X4C2_9MICO|nr:VOC family protein [Brachybacterium sacelli]MBP2383078.1 putative enzyme related to lactoylglutathione lyase [Brachybacterium sacelli]